MCCCYAMLVSAGAVYLEEADAIAFLAQKT